MGTTRIKVIDLSSDEKQIKTSRKHAEKLTGKAKAEKEEKKTKKIHQDQKKLAAKDQVEGEEKAEAEIHSDKPRETEKPKPSSSTPHTRPAVSTKAVKKKHSRHLGSSYLEAKTKIDKLKIYDAKEAFDLLVQTSFVKFDPTVELHLTVVDKKVRGSVNLPHMQAKEKKANVYLVFSANKDDIDGKKIIWGDESKIADIESGKLKARRDFDVVVATPQFMPQLAKIAKILGPVGLMPNPKNKTVTENIADALTEKVESGHEFTTETDAPIIHTTLGKLSQKQDELAQNAKVLISAIGPAKIKKATLTSSMGPPIKVEATSFIS